MKKTHCQTHTHINEDGCTINNIKVMGTIGIIVGFTYNQWMTGTPFHKKKFKRNQGQTKRPRHTQSGYVK
jgi:hypothetical protein